MRRRMLSLLLLSAAMMTGLAQSTVRCEYWVDNNYGGKQETAFVNTEDDASSTLNVRYGNLSPGLHVFCARPQDDQGLYGPLRQELLYVSPSSNEPESEVHSYEYWMDDDREQRHVMSVTGKTAVLFINGSTLPPGLHHLYIRVKNDKGLAGPLNRELFYVPPVNDNPASVASLYEYWMDNDYDGRTVRECDGEAVVIRDMSPGLHYFNVRVQDSQGIWGPLRREFFYLPPLNDDSDSEIYSCEYWLDNNQNGQVQTASVERGVALTIDGSNLNYGMHYLYVRTKSDNGQTGPLKREGFYLSPQNDNQLSTVRRCEFWIDDDYSKKTLMPINQNIKNSMPIDGSVLRPGQHYLRIRVQNEEGQWGPLQNYRFTIPSSNDEPESKLRQYEYWLDDDYEHREVKIAAVDKPTIPINGSEIGSGLHRFNARIQNDLDVWSPLMRKFFYLKPQNDELAKDSSLLVGYAYAFNDMATYVPITAVRQHDLGPLDIPVPDLSSYYTVEKGCTWTLTESLVTAYRTNPQTFSVRFYNAGGRWGPAKCSVFELKDTVSVVPYSLVDGQQVVMPLVESNGYEAIRLEVRENRDYVLQTTHGCRMLLLQADGTQLNSYGSEELLAGAHCTLTAGAVYYAIVSKMKKDNDNPDDLLSVRLLLQADMALSPVISYENEMVSITCEQEGANVFYTLDGSDPTHESTHYDGPFPLRHNASIKAVAYVEGLLPSDVALMVVDSYKVSTPTFAVDGTILSINCETKDVSIYYNIGVEDNPSVESTLYSGPIALRDNQQVKAIAVRSGYNDSDVALWQENVVTSLGVNFAYNGRKLVISPEEPEATVFYTLDGSEPTEASAVYTESLTIESLLTVKAAAQRPFTNLSPVGSMRLSYVFDGETVTTEETGRLAAAFEWCGLETVSTLRVVGQVDDNDFATLRSLPNLLTLDMQRAITVNGKIPDKALSGAMMRWFLSPESVSSVGKDVFSDCPQLAAVKWLPTSVGSRLRSEVFGASRNPNMLLYVSGDDVVIKENDVFMNIVTNGRAAEIRFEDGTTYHNFFCPEEFRADRISYVHDFKMRTQQGECRGWETLALPFDVQTVRHKTNGVLVPFGGGTQDNEQDKPYWLARLGSSGFEIASTIDANTPYIISMPNDSALYADRYLQAGEVTFSSLNTSVKVTEDIMKEEKGDIAFVANYELREPSADIYALNLYTAWENHLEGSIFRPNVWQVRPFEAYTTSLALNAPEYIDITDLIGTTNGITDLQYDHGWVDREVVEVFNLSGLLVVKGHRHEVMEHLPSGIYIVNGKKIVIR